MKLRTNLTPAELRKVGLGLQKLADKQQPNEIELENDVERRLIADAERIFKIAMTSLEQEMSRVMTEKDV